MARKKKAVKKKKAAKKIERQIRLLVLNTTNGSHGIFEGTEHTARTDAEEYIQTEMWEAGEGSGHIDDWLVFEITDYLSLEADDIVKVTIKYEN
jgi:hypothetical protein